MNGVQKYFLIPADKYAKLHSNTECANQRQDISLDSPSVDESSIAETPSELSGDPDQMTFNSQNNNNDVTFSEDKKDQNLNPEKTLIPNSAAQEGGASNISNPKSKLPPPGVPNKKSKRVINWVEI